MSGIRPARILTAFFASSAPMASAEPSMLRIASRPSGSGGATEPRRSRTMDHARSTSATRVGIATTPCARRGGFLAATCVSAIASLAPAQTEVLYEDAQLTGDEAAYDDSFGRAVAISGNRALVGAPASDVNGVDAGTGYMYLNEGGRWVREGTLLASDGHAYDSFGWSVALSGDVALVGAPGDAGGGAAYVFRRGDSGWLEEQELEPSGMTSGSFGRSVSLFEDRLLVGASSDGEQAPLAGAAHVFRFEAAGWVEEAKLLASDGAAGDGFGWTCSLGGDAALVGSSNSKSAYVFRRDGTAWLEEQILVATGGEDVGFGEAVALRGAVALVGTPNADDFGSSSGAAHVFRWNGARWLEEQKLLASDGDFNDWFGDAVALGDDVALVGARLAGPSAIDYGAAYVFRWNGSAWVETLRPTASDAMPESGFGRSVALSVGEALVGALAFTDAGTTSGSAYVYTLPTPWTDLGGALAGIDGQTPVLGGLGTLTPGSVNQLELSRALPGTTTSLVLGFSQIDAPFKGGVLVPATDFVIPGLRVDASGTSVLSFTWPAGIAAGTKIVWQHWIDDAAGPAGLAASNGLEGEAQ